MGRRPSNTAFELLQSLSPAERAYVRKALAKPMGRKAGSMLALYDVLITAKHAEDERVSTFLRKQPGGGSQLKRILVDQVLRILRFLSSNSSDRNSVNRIIEEAAILVDREMDAAAAERLREADDICERAHLFAHRSEVLSNLIRIYRRGAVVGGEETIPKLLAERERALKIAHDLSVLGQCSSRLLHAIRSPDRDSIAASMLSHPLVTPEYTADHVRVQFWQHHVRGMAHHMRGEIDEQDRALLAMMEIMQKHPVFLIDDVAITVLSNILTTNIQRRDTTSGRIALEMLKSITTSIPRLLDDLWYNVVRSELYLDLLDAQSERIFQAEALVHQGMAKYPIHGVVVHRTWRMLCASAYLQVNNPGQALIMIRTILDESGLPEGQYLAPRCIEIMALIMAGETELALYRIRSLERTFNHTKKERPFLHAFIRAARAIATQGRTEKSAVDGLVRILRGSIREPADRALRVTIDVDRWLMRYAK